MKIIALHKPVTGIIFDIDQTLYDHEGYYRSQQRILIEQLARELNRSYDQTVDTIIAYKREYAAQHNGREQSLGNILLHFGIGFRQHVGWRTQLFRPEDFLAYDENLHSALGILAEKCVLSAVTNNPAEIGKRTLEVLGAGKFFHEVIGLDTTGVSKPSLVPFEKAARGMGKTFAEIVSVGDRLAVDIEIPVAAGMGGILVESMDDVYSLPEIIGFGKDAQ